MDSTFIVKEFFTCTSCISVQFSDMVIRLHVLSHGELHLWALRRFFIHFCCLVSSPKLRKWSDFSFKGGIVYIPGPVLPLNHAWGWLRTCVSKNHLLHMCSVCQVLQGNWHPWNIDTPIPYLLGCSAPQCQCLASFPCVDFI